jgi:predicted alpha/beta superfamily hydrolase
MDELTPNEKYGGGKADDYLEFIVTKLKTKIDSLYRTKTTAKHNYGKLWGLVSFGNYNNSKTFGGGALPSSGSQKKSIIMLKKHLK